MLVDLIDDLVRLAVYLLLLAFYIYMVRVWVRWLRATSRFPPPRWRNVLAFAGLLLGSASALWGAILVIHAHITNGLPYYHPVLLASIRYGCLASLLGLLFSGVGKGITRLPGITGTSVTLLFWVGVGILQ